MDRCPLCNATGGRVVLDASGGIELVRCEQCGLVRLGPSTAPASEEHYEYYADRLSLDRDQLYLPLTTDRLRDIAARIRVGAPLPRLLDIGCGEGQMVYAASLEDWDAHGVDLSKAATAIGRRFGLACETVDVFSDSLEPGSFGAITMIELIEHVPMPTRMLARAADLLAPGGCVYLTTPNYASLGRTVLGRDWIGLSDEHLTYFTPKTMRRLASDAGLDVESIVTKNLSAAALRRIGRRLRVVRADAPAPVDADEAGAHVGETFVAEQRLRGAIESSPALRVAKRAANLGLRVTRAGETIEAVLRKPRS